MAIMKVIEILSDSKKSWEDATARGVARAGKNVKNIKSAYVQSQSVVVKNNKVAAYRVNLKITFEAKEMLNKQLLNEIFGFSKALFHKWRN